MEETAQADAFDAKPAGRGGALAPARSAPSPVVASGCMNLIVKLVLFPILGLVAMFIFASTIAAAIFSGDSDKVAERFHSLDESAKNKIAIIAVEGAIIDGEGFVKKQIDAVRNDPDVKGIVLRINSPGGSVTASDYMLHHLVKLREERGLPIVVSMGGIAASGGYYVAMAVGDQPNSIFAEPTTWTGSIGVVIPHFNVEGLMKRFEIEDDSVKSHPLKQMGSPSRKLTDQERRIFQGLVDDCFDTFKRVVKSGRKNMTDAKLAELATGQVFTTRQALDSGLVDKEGFIEEAIDRAIELANLTKDGVKVVRYRRPPVLFDFLPSAQAKSSRGPDAQALLDLLSPRAYYLCTWLPVAAASGELSEE
jgi:protease-4